MFLLTFVCHSDGLLKTIIDRFYFDQLFDVDSLSQAPLSEIARILYPGATDKQLEPLTVDDVRLENWISLLQRDPDGEYTFDIRSYKDKEADKEEPKQKAAANNGPGPGISVYRKKAVFLKCAAILVKYKFDGVVPCHKDALLQFPGVSSKVALIVIQEAHAIPGVGIAVDVHVKRLSLALGFFLYQKELTKKDKYDVHKLPNELCRLHLEQIFPAEEYANFNILVAGLGQLVNGQKASRVKKVVMGWEESKRKGQALVVLQQIEDFKNKKY